jgi:hypothetical protein
MPKTNCSVACKSIHRFIFSLFLGAFVGSFLHAQEPTPESFFPHHVGDTWVYYVLDGAGNDTLVVRIVGDSIGLDGTHFVKTWRHQVTPPEPEPNRYPWYDECRVDTVGRVYATGLGPREILLYDFRVPVGSFWIADTLYPPMLNIAKVMEYYSATVFGVPTVVKGIGYFHTADTSDTTKWLSQYGDQMASGFGLVMRGAGDLGYELFAIAASIGGRVFGDTSLLRTVPVDTRADPSLPNHVVLAQNYPNPFNGSTWIEFYMPQRQGVRIVVYDILGREVVTLASGSFGAGIHRIRWAITGAASGVYLCVLTAGNTLQTRKMIFQR